MDFDRLSWIGEDHYIEDSSKGNSLHGYGRKSLHERKGVDIAAKAVQLLNEENIQLYYMWYLMIAWFLHCETSCGKGVK